MGLLGAHAATTTAVACIAVDGVAVVARFVSFDAAIAAGRCWFAHTRCGMAHGIAHTGLATGTATWSTRLASFDAAQHRAAIARNGIAIVTTLVSFECAVAALVCRLAYLRCRVAHAACAHFVGGAKFAVFKFANLIAAIATGPITVITTFRAFTYVVAACTDR